jgi:hypothetical protein
MSAGGNAMSISGMAEQDIAGYIGSYAATKAEDVAIGHGMDEIRDSYKKATGRYDPYTGVGKMGVQRLSDLGNFSFNPSDLQNDPGYQFQRQQGQQGINASAFAKGIGTSGATAQAMDYFDQQLSGTAYQGAFNRTLEGYKTNAGVGEWETQFGGNVAGSLATLDQNYGENMSNLQLQRGNARAAGWKGAQQAAQSQGSHLQQIGQMDLGGSGGGSSGGSGGGGFNLSSLGSMGSQQDNQYNNSSVNWQGMGSTPSA